MKRLAPYLIFVLLTGGLVAFIYKDQLLARLGGETGGGAQGVHSSDGQGGGRRRFGGGGAGRGQRDQIVAVLAERAKTDNVPVYLTGVGTVQAYTTATVRAQVSGRLIDVSFHEGQDVKAGDVLARIDPVLYQAIYDQAVAQKAKDEALLANARLDEKRYWDLAKVNGATQQQADTARATARQVEAQVKTDQAIIDNAKANLDYTTIRAPIDGRTGLRLVDKGNLVSSVDATGIVIVTQLRPITVVFTLPEDTVAEVLDAQSRGTVPLQAVTGGKLIGEGALHVVDNQIDQATGTVRIKGTFPNEQNRLWPGQFVNIKLKLKTLENAIVVPSAAVQQGAQGSYVYLVTPENTAKLTNVKVAQEDERQAVIAEGVQAGDLVVTTGFANLQDGAKVRVENAAGGGEASSGGSEGQGQTASDGGAGAKAQAAPAAPAQERPKRRRGSEANANGNADGQTNNSAGRRRRAQALDSAQGAQRIREGVAQP